MYIPNQNPLNININPPGIQSGMPGDTVKIHVVVTNNGNQDAVINLFLNIDEELTKLIAWSNSPRESISLSPNQSSNEITFEFPIPVNASPGTYDYTLVIDSPEHYPQHTPINCPSQIKILFKEQTKIGLNDPTFFIKPSTNPNKPLIFKPGEALQLEVQVNNNSDRVDRFRLNCPDFDENWFTISYPKTGLESSGLTEVKALELNNKSQSTILLQLHPPIDALEGNYNPAIRLHSENHPDLVLLDLVYTQIPPNYRLDIELETVLGQVSYRPGQYILSIINQGNLIRELIFNAKSRDEDEICKYNFDPTEVKLLPLKETEVSLKVKPRGWWRRPWLGGGRTIHFQVELEDKQKYPLPDRQNQATLIWKSRPIWQFLLLLLFALGFFGGIAFILWRLLNPEPLQIVTFSANNSEIIEGGEVRLSWEITKYNQLKKLELNVKEPNTELYNFLEGDFRQKLSSCDIKQNILKCSNYNMGKKGITGEYSFDLQAEYSKGSLPFSKINIQQTKAKEPVKVIVKEKPIAEVEDFKVSSKEYKKGDDILFNWKIKNPTLLKAVQISGKTAEGKAIESIPFSLKYIEENCQKVENEQALECKNIPIPASKIGTFVYKITAFTDRIKRNSSKEAENAIEVLPQQFNISSFTVNGQQSIEIEEGEQVLIAWNVKGKSEDIQVGIDCIGSNLPLTGTKRIFVTNPQCKLQVSDKFKILQPQYQVINIRVKPKPQPTPTVIIPAPDFTPNNPTNNPTNNTNPATTSRRTRRRNIAIPFPNIDGETNPKQTDRNI
jgi:hypothetical protein